jgi:hypothetical protein
MQLYIITIIIFLFINFFASILIKKYTYEKFFIYVIFYFLLSSFINLIYLQNVDLFTFSALFSVVVLLLYSALYRSVSVKIIIYLYLKKASIDINNFYKTEFKKKSFDKRVKILIDSGFIIKKNKHLILSENGKKYLKIFKAAQSFYRIKFSG